MSIMEAGVPLTRRRALKMGAGLAGGLIAVGGASRALADENADDYGNGTVPSKEAQNQISDILEVEGQVANGVYQVEIDRNDINDVMLHGVPILPSFQINGTTYFQSLGNGQTMMNGDMALKPSELDPFIGTLIQHNLVFQAEHQHMYDFNPMVWFVHYRGVGDEEALAQGLKAALNQTATPFPQTLPSNPTTPLPAKEIGNILGSTPQIGADGVVTYDIPRAESIWLGGHKISPYLNVASTIVFEPYGGGRNAAVVPDFALTASEINKVVGYMRRQKSWDIGCLYNQETAESPQLYFSHQFKVGDSVNLAREIRAALNMMNVKFQ